jgi:hypothetical protein
MNNFGARLYSELIDGGLVIVGVSIGNESDTSTWTVQPESEQPSAQPIIDAINVNDWIQDNAWADLRVSRNAKLDASDWTQASDTALTEEQVEEWRVYRHALRDLPSNTVDPFNPQWPTPPAT